MLIVFGCVLVNFLGKYLAAELELPLWLDCLGTVFAAYVLGPISGAVVGCTVNIMYSFRDPSSLIYGITSIFIGLVVGLAARKRYFESFFKATSLAGGVAIGSVVISTVFNILLYQGKTGNVWGDGVRDFLMERGMAGILASAVGELYVDFLDKLVTILAVYVLIRIVRIRPVAYRFIMIKIHMIYAAIICGKRSDHLVLLLTTGLLLKQCFLVQYFTSGSFSVTNKKKDDHCCDTKDNAAEKRHMVSDHIA